MHGGRQPMGVASATFKTGKFSASLPERLAYNYEQALTNPDLVSLRDELAFIDMHYVELVTRMRDGGDSLKTWKLLRETSTRYRQTKKIEAKAEYLEMMLDLIDKGGGQAAIWGDIYAAMSLRKRLVDTEFRRTVQYGHMINVEQLMALMGRLVSTIKTYVDKDQLARLTGELRGLVHQGDNGQSGIGTAATIPRPRTDRVREGEETEV